MTDITDPDDGRISQNIVHQFPDQNINGERCSLWKRIDFIFRSIKIDFNTLSKFIKEKKDRLMEYFGGDRYEML